MMPWSSLLFITHLLGLALATGAATVKVILLLRCGSDHEFTATFLKVSRIITRQIIAGMILLTLSGVIWLVQGYDFSPVLIVKLVLFGLVWILGPYIDNSVEPRFRKLAPTSGAEPTPEFTRMWKQYVVVDSVAALLFYAVIVIWILQ